ncbi:hypothetical protein QQ020_06050 [Fulvivirgaceae bacterium BMA12]|uniref:Tetratricopeptide repeat protein n=1 Tax=Agaribacillus aureus TaxID=3051825 RepID=A0ABT8L3L9_9BACT|nr:hypothetical protein [Fulvivirgaceae bacterium BMA12]
MNNSITIDEVRDFLLDRLPERRKKRIAERLKTDEDFRNEFYHCKALLAGMEHHFDRQLKEKLKKGDRKKKRTTSRVNMAIAAGIMLLILAAAILLISRSGDHVVLFNRYYSHYYNVVSDAGRSRESALSPYENAFREYEVANFTEAVRQFEEQIQIRQEDNQLIFYYGLSLLGNNQPGKAVAELAKVADSEHPFNEPAAWYLALSYLRLNDLKMSKEVLIGIINTESEYHMRAEELLNEID